MHRSFGIYGVSSRNGKQHVKPRLAFVRTYSGIARARDAGKRFGHPLVLNEEQKQKVLECIKSGAGISSIVREFRTTRQTILRVRAKSVASINAVAKTGVTIDSVFQAAPINNKLPH